MFSAMNMCYELVQVSVNRYVCMYVCTYECVYGFIIIIDF